MDILPDDAPSPRLCHLIKWPDFDGYGFNLHAERSNPGQFIGKIDEDSPAEMAGLREGDRIVEVNGVNINNENHRQVVERIKSDPNETRLLVVDPETDLWYREQDQVVKSNQVNVVYMKTPVPRPKPDSPRANIHRQVSDQFDDSHDTHVGASTASASLSPTNGGSSSLESNDFNEDSIEQERQKSPEQSRDHEQVCPVKMTRELPPMSPDSGKGDEEPSQPAEVVVEAEINRQSPVKPILPHGRSQDNDNEQQQESDDEHNKNKNLAETIVADYDSGTQDMLKGQGTLHKQQVNEIQPDSLSQAGSSMSPVSPSVTQVSKQLF